MNTSESAFPVPGVNGADGLAIKGLSKRELFAAMAMQGLLANPDPARRVPGMDMAGAAIGYADALLTALGASGGEGA